MTDNQGKRAEYPFPVPPEAGDFGGIGGAGLTPEVIKALQTGDVGEIDNWLTLEDDYVGGRRQETGGALSDYSLGFEPFEGDLPSGIEDTPENRFKLGQENLGAMKQKLAEENIGNPEYIFTVDFDGDAKTIGVYDIMTIPKTFIEFYKEAYYWASYRVQVNKYLAGTILSQRSKKFEWINNIMDPNREGRFWLIFDITSPPPNVIGHINISKITVYGYEGSNSQHSVGQVIYDPKYFGKGIGTHTLGFAICEAKKTRLDYLRADIIKFNEASIRLFEKMGFEASGRESSYEGVDGSQRVRHEYILDLNA